MKFLATCPAGLETLLVEELQQLGAETVKSTGSGAEFEGDLVLAYKACLWSRLANRVLMPVAEAAVETAEQLYDAVQTVDWLNHFGGEQTFSVNFTGGTRSLKHSHFAALKVKDAVVDQFRARSGERPSISKDQPDIRIHAHVFRGRLTLSLDLSGESLHRRGYRLSAGAAPLKENLAAAILMRAKWPERTGDEAVLFDPMCGAGTLLIEAAMMSADIAPGLLRERFGFESWLQHDAQAWQALLDDAHARQQQGISQSSAQLFGADQDPVVLSIAKENAAQAGVASLISWQQTAVEAMQPPVERPGLLVTNPPYGERLGESDQLMFFYRQLGNLLKQRFGGWQAGIFTGNPELAEVVGLKPERSYRFFNGPIESRLFLYQLYVKTEAQLAEQQAQQVIARTDTAQMFENRLRKNLKALKRWQTQQNISCYRVYDADIPEYAVAVDVYNDWAHVQEYAPPKSVDKVKAFERLNDVLSVVPEVLGIAPDKVVLKQRKRQTGTDQYEKQSTQKLFFQVQEHGCKLRVNLHDYLDTGLFLDHRPVRKKIQDLAQGKDFLNLFCYTASASVHAAVGGARSTTSVDMSATYIQWAMKNLAINGFSDRQHHFIQSDCFAWLKKQRKPQFDVIFMDPPTFSNSKRMQSVLDVQRDHVDLIRMAMRLLRKDGVLIFSNNFRKFKLDYAQLAHFEVTEITQETIDPDFKRNSRIHCCFEIRWPQ